MRFEGRRLRGLRRAAVLLSFLLAWCATGPAPARTPLPAALTPAAVRDDLEEGNRRFVAGRTLERDLRAQVAAMAPGQYPKAAILSCMDSRVPIDLLFDQRIGELLAQIVPAGRVRWLDEDKAPE